MDNVDTTAPVDHEAAMELFGQDFTNASYDMLCAARETLYELDKTPTPENIIAQILMDMLGVGTNWSDPTEGKFTTAQKARFVEMADHMGPDWAQALYHAAVFITKVA